MRYIIDLPDAEVQKIKALIANRKYEDIHSFILTAIENQIYIENQPIASPISDFSESTRKEKLNMPSLTNQLDSNSSIVTVLEPQPEALNAETLWVLHNRIFPIKVSLRVLLNILESNPANDGYVDLISVQEAAVEEARKVGHILSKMDKSYHRLHGEKLSAGLPSGTKDPARDRFKLNFVGSINSKNRLGGAPAILHFINITRDQKGQSQIGITKSGFEFATIENPVLDKEDYTRTLSEEESNFYLKHISEKLPKEYSISVNILKAISDGHNTPNELTDVTLKTKSDLKKDEAQTIRASLISRLFELGLLTRKRTGLNVTYFLTGKSTDLLKKILSEEP